MKHVAPGKYKIVCAMLMLLLGALGCLRAQVITKSILDFGAKPNDMVSDQAAFNAAAKFINQRRGSVKLVLPAGKYLVGPPYNYKAKLNGLPIDKVWDVFRIENCRDVMVEGQGITTIQFMDGIPFGATENTNKPQGISVHIGSLFRFINSRDIKITNVIADGNSSKFRLLANYGVGPKAFERENEGLFILNCADVKVDQCTFKNFGRDGCMVLQDPGKIPVENLSFSNTSFINNGRNGFSWCGGKNVVFKNCRFNNNCRGRIQSNPGAGLDIEPERGAICKNGSFQGCEFINNGGYAVTSAYEEAMDVAFEDCKIIGNTNYALFTVSPRFSFDDCVLGGTSLLYCNQDNPDDATTITACTFTDSIAGQLIQPPTYLVAVTGRYTKFEKSTFNAYYSPALYIEVKKKAQSGRQDNVVFEKCHFNAFFTRPTTWDKRVMVGGAMSFEDCTFYSRGFADYSLVFNETWRKIYQKGNSFTKAPVYH